MKNNGTYVEIEEAVLRRYDIWVKANLSFIHVPVTIHDHTISYLGYHRFRMHRRKVPGKTAGWVLGLLWISGGGALQGKGAGFGSTGTSPHRHVGPSGAQLRSLATYGWRWKVEDMLRKDECKWMITDVNDCISVYSYQHVLACCFPYILKVNMCKLWQPTHGSRELRQMHRQSSRH